MTDNLIQVSEDLSLLNPMKSNEVLFFKEKWKTKMLEKKKDMQI